MANFSPTEFPQLLTIVDDVQRLVGQAERLPIFGFTGCPGVGKSTLVELLSSELARRGMSSAIVPMDGFHLSNGELSRLGLGDRKGTMETFDAAGYLELLRRLHREEDHVVYIPTYDRTTETSLAGDRAIGQVDCVLTEGNYLLAQEPLWRNVAGELEAVWFLKLPEGIRRRRLLARRLSNGQSYGDALEWMARVDDANAKLISELEYLADYLVEMV